MNVLLPRQIKTKRNMTAHFINRTENYDSLRSECINRFVRDNFYL